MRKQLLLINPWIHDFAAYDFWLRPMGLLRLAASLRRWGFQVRLVDCLDRYNTRLLERQHRSSPRGKPDGRGKFHKEDLPKPHVLREIRRKYSRYGLPPDIYLEELASGPQPDAVLVTSSMTYWYPGVQETIAETRKVFPDAAILLGGTYATLMPDHARLYSGADHVFEGRDLSMLAEFLENETGCEIAPQFKEDHRPDDEHPAYDLLTDASSLVINSSWGCPFRCSYCATWRLSGEFHHRDPQLLVDEIERLTQQHKTKHFVFFDDALLFRRKTHLEPILRDLLGRKIEAAFHTPNAIHPRYVDREVASLMHEAGFETIRLGLETASSESQRRTGGKITRSEFTRATARLEEAGFSRRDIGVYALIGLPGQDAEEIRETLRFIHDHGCAIKLSSYSPIPGTEEWQRAVAWSDLPIASDPLLHNGSVYPIRTERMSWSAFDELKALALELNSAI